MLPIFIIHLNFFLIHVSTTKKLYFWLAVKLIRYKFGAERDVTKIGNELAVRLVFAPLILYPKRKSGDFQVEKEQLKVTFVMISWQGLSLHSKKGIWFDPLRVSLAIIIHHASSSKRRCVQSSLCSLGCLLTCIFYIIFLTETRAKSKRREMDA